MDEDMIAELIDQQLNNRLSLDRGMASAGTGLQSRPCPNRMCKRPWHGLPLSGNEYRTPCDGSHLYDDDGKRIEE